MSLVDLRKRVDEPRVAALVEESHSSAASAERALENYRSERFILIGWEESCELIGCVGVERAASELFVRSLAVAPEHRRRGVGRVLVDALGDVSTGTDRLIAETDGDAVGFYERCGFRIERAPSRRGRHRYRCTREIEVHAAPAEAVAAVTLADLEGAVRQAWSRETSEDPDDWTETNPAAGQCSVTALVVRDLLGGEILLAGVLRDGRRVERHAWNRLPSGLALDLTREQFRAGETFEEPRVGDPLVALRDKGRYALFAERVRTSLEQLKPT